LATQALNPTPPAAQEALPEPLPPAPTPLPRGRSFVHKSVLTIYRIFAVVTLYGVLLGILAYAFIMGFYAVNTTWAAPVIISASDEKSLDYLAQLVTSRQTIEDLKVDVVHQQTTLAEMTKQRAALAALDPEIEAAIARERSHDQLTGPQLQALDTQKQADNAKTQAVLAQLEQLEFSINKDLAAGLITKSDAASQIAAINQSRDAYTDSRIAEVLLTDNIFDATMSGTKPVEVIEKQAELRSDIAQLDVSLAVAEKQLEEDNRQIDRLRAAIATAKESPYYLNANGDSRLNFAFVPYDNQASATVGAPIYDCYLDMVLCRKVGDGQADIFRRTGHRAPDLQDPGARLHDPDGPLPSRLRPVQDRLPWS
jgi:DNA-binding helix-hairpin-helix protein with protein kinase domain